MKEIGYKNIFLVIIAIISMFALEKIADENNFDKKYQVVDLIKKDNEECIVDIHNMGIIKYYVEPNIITIYLRLKVDNEMKNLSFITENIEAIISQSSKKGVWQSLDNGEAITKNNKNIVPLNIELKIPREDVYQYDVLNGNLKIFNNKQVIKNIKIKVINSKYK